MPSVLVSNFTGGEVSPRIYARPEVSKAANALRTAENAICSVHGGAYKRSGTRFVIELKDSTTHRFIPFQAGVSESYMLLLGNGYMWFAKDQGIITKDSFSITGITQANPAVVTTSTGSGYSNGDYVYITGVEGMEEVNNRRFVVANISGSTFELQGVDSSGYEAYTSGGTVGDIVEISHNYTTAQLSELQVVHYNNVMYFAHQSHPVAKLTRTTDTVWTLENVVFETGPFRTINSDDTLTITPSSFSTSATAFGTYTVGTTCTLTASSALFDDDHVGSFWRLNEPGSTTGIAAPPLGESVFVVNGDSYTNQTHVYGINNLSAGGVTWQTFTRVPEHTAGTVRVYAGGRGPQTTTPVYFDSNYLHSGYCVVKITAVTSSTVATAEIVRYQMPQSIASGGTSFWEEGAWSTYRGYPRAIAFYEQRLFLGGGIDDPVVVWGSRSGAFEDFEDGPEDDDAVTFRLAAARGDVIRWMEGTRVLVVGTSSGEYAVAASSQQEALTPTNVKSVKQTSIGSSSCLPIQIDQNIVYAEREGEPDNNAIRLREFSYSFTDDRFGSVDLTIFAEHILGAGVTRLAYAQCPEQMIWALRSDGTLAACTYQRAQDVVPWHRHSLGGSGALVKELAVTAGQDSDEVWLQVNRTIDGGTAAYAEILLKRFRENRDTKTNGVFLDSSLTYSGSEISTLNGLWHLRGEAVTALVDGHKQDVTVSDGGSITLDPAGSTITVGYNYQMTLETQEFEGTAQGSRQGRMTRISQVRPRLLQSLGGTIGSTASDQKPILYRTESMAMDDSPDLKDGFAENDFTGGYDRTLIIRIEHSDPFPFHITGIQAEATTS